MPLHTLNLFLHFIFQRAMKLDFGIDFEASVEVVVGQRDNRLRNFEINLLFKKVSMVEVDVRHTRIEIQPRIT